MGDKMDKIDNALYDMWKDTDKQLQQIGKDTEEYFSKDRYKQELEDEYRNKIDNETLDAILAAIYEI